MPIIKDGQTPEGRVVECRKGKNNTSECRVRMMTPEERAYYGEAVPRLELAKFGLRPNLKKQICEVFSWEVE